MQPILSTTHPPPQTRKQATEKHYRLLREASVRVRTPCFCVSILLVHTTLRKKPRTASDSLFPSGFPQMLHEKGTLASRLSSLGLTRLHSTGLPSAPMCEEGRLTAHRAHPAYQRPVFTFHAAHPASAASESAPSSLNVCGCSPLKFQPSRIMYKLSNLIKSWPRSSLPQSIAPETPRLWVRVPVWAHIRKQPMNK